MGSIPIPGRGAQDLSASAIGNILERFSSNWPMVQSADAFIQVDDLPSRGQGESNRGIFRGIGRFNVPIDSFTELLDHELMEAVGRGAPTAGPSCWRTGVILPLLDEHSNAIGAIFVPSSHLEGVRLLEIYARQAASSVSNAFCTPGQHQERGAPATPTPS